MSKSNLMNKQELITPSWFDHNQDGYVGQYEMLKNDTEQVNNNFFKVAHFFKYEPLEVSPRLTDIQNPNIRNEDVQVEYKRVSTKVLMMTRVPMPHFNTQGKIDFKFLDEYAFENSFNPYMGKQYAAEVYGRTDFVNLPAITREESIKFRNNDTRPIPISNTVDPRITNSAMTIDFLRQQKEYGSNLIEYILMSFGEVEIKQEDGTFKKIGSDENVVPVPIIWNKNYVLPAEATKDDYKYMVSIHPVFMRNMNQQLGMSQDVSAERFKAINSVQKMTATHKEVFDELTKMTEQEAADFKEFMASKKLKINVTNNDEPKMSLEEAQKQYEIKFGEKPHHNAKLETILEKLNATK